MANLDVQRFLNSDDLIEVGMLQRVAARVHELQEIRDSNLAKRIRNEVIEGFGG